ncbi:MAG: hypothetical protein JSU90_06670 [Nitrospiraceae bacterium]|nr:MAG: hypothetical protein JSU90_06670 [Nitrospiraceae bacterium]
MYDRRSKATADLITTEDETPRDQEPLTLHQPVEEGISRTLHHHEISEIEPLLVEVLREGQPVCSLPSIEDIRESRRTDVARLDHGVKRLISPHVYHVSLSERLWNLKRELVASVRK